MEEEEEGRRRRSQEIPLAVLWCFVFAIVPCLVPDSVGPKPNELPGQRILDCISRGLFIIK
jgi:hypothetical protein